MNNEGDQDLAIMQQYFDLIHNQERVEYLMLQQSVVDQVLAVEATESVFLADRSEPQEIKMRLNTEEGLRYYEHYLGDAKNKEKRNNSLTFWLIHILLAAICTTFIVFVARKVWQWLIMRD